MRAAALLVLAPSLAHADAPAWMRDCEARLNAAKTGAWKNGRVEWIHDRGTHVSFSLEGETSAFVASVGPEDEGAGAPAKWSTQPKDEDGQLGTALWRAKNDREAELMALASPAKTKAFIATFRPILDRCLLSSAGAPRP